MKKALITGKIGQDDSYLAEPLRGNGYEVHGLIRLSSSFNTERTNHPYKDVHEAGNHLFLYLGDLSDSVSFVKMLWELKPGGVYRLCVQSHVRVSFDISEYRADITGFGTDRLLEAIRESYGMHASNGILFNHESPRRGKTFETQKITRAATLVKLGLQDALCLGSIGAKRNCGYAKEYTEALCPMLQQDKPDDYVIATKETHSVKVFCQEVISHLALDWQQYIHYDTRHERPSEVDQLLRNPQKSKKQLNCEPKVSFKELAKIIIERDTLLAKKEKACQAFL